MKLGMIVRADDTGLGNQTHELVKMLNPEKILLIDSSKFHNKGIQHYDWYENNNVVVSKGFPDNNTVVKFFSGINVVFSCETFYNKDFVALAKRRRIKTILQYNFEFLENLSNEKAALPDVLLAPSLWRFEEVVDRFNDKCLVKHLPPPTSHEIFKNNRKQNRKRNNKILHVGGKAAIYDRNGTNSVIEMLKYSKEDYELVIRSQTDLQIKCDDKRVTFMIGNEEKRENLYCGYDAMVLPRRYAGLCLPMNEALISGLPVFMTDISPNNIVLPESWLAESHFVKSFMSRIGVDLYNASPESLAKTVDNYFSQDDLSESKDEAFFIGYQNFSSNKLKEKYEELIENI
jgi:glycosyltransferase involved in cell wall biosynthesis